MSVGLLATFGKALAIVLGVVVLVGHVMFLERMDAMETVKKLLSSKKAVMALLGAIAWGAGRAGFDINPEDLYPIVGLLGLYVGSEAAVDMARAKSPTLHEAANSGSMAIKPRGPK